MSDYVERLTASPTAALPSGNPLDLLTPIAAARLLVIPEVTTWVACQDAEEGRARVTPERATAR